MWALGSSRHDRLHLRRCLTCGYDGTELQGRGTGPFVCPACGEDLYARPPRSYAELEAIDDPGLPGEQGPSDPHVASSCDWVARLIGWFRRRLKIWTA